MKEPFDPESTRLAKVDPKTGVELTQHPRGTEFELDATVLGISRPDPTIDKPEQVEFVPPSGARATGEITSIWRDQVSLFDKVRGGLSRLGPAVRRRRVVVSVLGVFLILGAAAYILLPNRRPQTPKPMGPISSVEPAPTATVPRKNSPADMTVTLEDPTTPQEKKVTLGTAIESLISGNLRAALSDYETLARRSPDDTSYRVAMDILRRQMGAKDR